MITASMVTQWHVCTPHLFRYLPKVYVDSFFEDGSLRLSSFEQFHQHTDEQRGDGNEGLTLFSHRTQSQGGQTMIAVTKHGIDAYVLSTTMRHDPELMREFGCNSYIRIVNSTGFGMAVARYVPSLAAGYEGPCIYQSKRTIDCDLDYIDLEKYNLKADEDDGPLETILEKEPLMLDENHPVRKMIFQKMGHVPLFLKELKFATQSEYLFAWHVTGHANKYIDIKVPEARRFCEKPNELTE